MQQIAKVFDNKDSYRNVLCLELEDLEKTVMLCKSSEFFGGFHGRFVSTLLLKCWAESLKAEKSVF